MSGHHPISKLFDRFTPKEKQEIRADMDVLREEMTLQELREALHIQQGELGAMLGIKQAAVSRMERRNDILLSSLRKAVEAMGGELIITARFSNAEVRLNKG
jgi:predicted transcriptional regulator